MAEELPRIDVAEVVAGNVEQAKAALEKGAAVVRVYNLPAPEIKIRAKKRIIKIDEGKVARLAYALVYAAASGKGGFTFKEYADVVGDYKAAAAYLARLALEGLVTPQSEDVVASLVVAANALSQKTYERRISRILEARFNVNQDALKRLGFDDIVCAQRGGRVLCRYVTAAVPRSIAKAQARAIISLAGFKPA